MNMGGTVSEVKQSKDGYKNRWYVTKPKVTVMRVGEPSPRQSKSVRDVCIIINASVVTNHKHVPYFFLRIIQ